MGNQSDEHREEVFIAELRDCAESLIEQLQQENYNEASRLIQNLARTRDSDIFQSVGKLTRGLHNAIANIPIGTEVGTATENNGIQDASDRLNYVIDLTQKAADNTMDMVDAATPVAAQLGREAAGLKGEWARLKNRDMAVGEFRSLYTRIDEHLDHTCASTEKLSGSLQNIVLEQGFQDLTGQVLKRVIGLLQDVERDLVDLVRIAGQVEDITGLTGTADKASAPTAVKEGRDTKAEGPQIHASTRDDVVSGQDDVDDLLSSLGF
ncbi:protein phosphatase CheZ [Exilibacterium tricleocarpae]|uniref:Protein phosphatase CheZ n=1 Tax=Exilibacterium tricleocarpae TaxID=2591008 RepID=A0A545U3Y0_9GAMM|nr:protein phosphatase CheZ [Exilibacterium tricleocarpae]TQV84191.1 protein phosphatase CheZ [Exilibacterium tricleocarpae]